jgi:tetratricopeptide (TPR) repeat protein
MDMSSPWKRKAVAGLLVAMAGLASAQWLAAQDQHDHISSGAQAAPSESDLGAGVARDFLERPLPLNQGLTRVEHPVQAATSEAVTYYEQGLTYYYLYHYLNAVRSFNEALRRDPELLPAYAGLSRALASLGARDEAERVLDRAHTVIQESREEGSRALDPLGVVLVELRRVALDARNQEGRRRLGEALDGAVAERPDDVELQMLRAMNARGDERIQHLEALLKRAPDHVGARHQLVHEYERRGDYARSLEHGAALAELAPTVPHGLHMYGHSLVATGRVGEALERFAAADSLERTYFEREGIPEHYDWHHPHNLHLLGLALWHEGSPDAAEAVLRRRAALELPEHEAEAWLAGDVGDVGDFLLAEGRGDDVLDVVGQMEGAKSPIPRFRAGLLKAEARLLLNDPAAARAALDRAVQILDELGARGDPAAERRIRRIEAQILLHQGELAEVERRLPELIEDLADYGGPDGWIVTVMELRNLRRSAHKAGAHHVAARIESAMVEHGSTLGASDWSLGKEPGLQ